MPSNIELSKPRDFGEVINDTFVFVRQNFKPLLKYFFIFCGFFMLAIIATSILQRFKMISGVSNPDPQSFVDNSSPYRYFGIEFWLSMLFIILGYTAIAVTVICYITLYKIKGNIPPDTEEMWGYFKFYFLKASLYSFLLVILQVVGFAFCLIPGIYLSPIFGLVLPIMIIENTTFGYAFNQSFKLIKDNWWVTFGTLFIMVIIVYIASMIVIVPSTLLNLSGLLLHKTDSISMAATIISVVLQHIALIFQILPLVAVSLCYFNLTESKEGTGLLDRIKDFGTGKQGENIIPEEY